MVYVIINDSHVMTVDMEEERRNNKKKIGKLEVFTFLPNRTEMNYQRSRQKVFLVSGKRKKSQFFIIIYH